MPEKMERNLAVAFAIESKAAARFAAFALKAEREGHHGIARLLRAVADAKSVHSRRFLLLMRGKIGTTEHNLETALRTDIKAKDELYPEMVQEAKGASSAVRKAFFQSMNTDGEHAELCRNAMEDMLAGRERQYYVCQICGHISEGFLLENCPVDHAVKGRFKKIL